MTSLPGLALVSICEIDVTSFSEDGRVLNGYVTNPNPTPTLTPNSNPNQINEKIQKETTLEIDQITKCQFGRWKLVKTHYQGRHFKNEIFSVESLYIACPLLISK
jgi:hypothetical protein